MLPLPAATQGSIILVGIIELTTFFCFVFVQSKEWINVGMMKDSPRK